MDEDVYAGMDQFERVRNSSEQHLAVDASHAGESYHDFTASAREPRLNDSEDIQSTNYKTPCDAASKTNENHINWEESSTTSNSDTGFTSMSSWSKDEAQQAQVIEKNHMRSHCYWRYMTTFLARLDH